jgi:peptide/nickel transport system ATP-binding protein
MPEETVLDIRGLSVTYNNKDASIYAVNDVWLDLNRGDSMGIVGESGSGKTTLAMAVLRLLNEGQTSISGVAEFLGQDLFHLTGEALNKLRWKRLSAVFQRSMNSFSPVHRIGPQIVAIYRVHEPGVSRELVYEKMDRILRMVNLNNRVYQLYPHEMSGGMLQRVTIAASLLHEPDLLIMDEATTALDVVTQGQLLAELGKMERELHTSRLIITHDMSVVAASCNRITVMYAGFVMESGPVQGVLQNPAHPYTRGLIAAIPSLRGDKTGLSGIPGFLPDLSRKAAGCCFAPRCDRGTEKCRSLPPPRIDLGQGRRVFCHLAEGAAPKNPAPEAGN